MLSHNQPSPMADSGKPLPMHDSPSSDVTRPNLAGIKTRPNQLQYQSPQEMTPNSYNGDPSASGADHFQQTGVFKRSNSDGTSREQPSSTGIPNSRQQRHSSFGVSDSKPADFSRPLLQTTVGPYGLLSSASGNQNYHSTSASPQGYVSQQNFPPFSLPPPGFAPSTTTAPATRETEPTYTASLSTEYPSDPIHHQQSGPDMMLLDQMTAPNTVPVFGGEGYNRSPFAIPEDFVAYLFSNQQLENSSPMGHMGPQGYATLVD